MNESGVLKMADREITDEELNKMLRSLDDDVERKVSDMKAQQRRQIFRVIDGGLSKTPPQHKGE